METKQTFGHMTHFLKERDDWKFIYDVVCEARHWAMQRNAVSFPAARIEKAVSMSHHYANRQYPVYQMHPYPTSFQATDNVIIWREAGKILLGQKKNKKFWQFPGGFVDPKDSSLEEACMRKREEECANPLTSICSRPEYLDSFRVDDPRYKDSPDKIMSAIFISYYISGKVVNGDDLVKVKWFTKDYLRRHYAKCLMPMHHPIIDALVRHGYM